MEQTLPIELNICVNVKNRFPQIELRRRITTNKELAKFLISAAIHETPVVFIPRFTNKIISFNSMIEKGIIYRNEEDGNYYFVE